MVKCASPKCDFNEPYMCPDGTCKNNMAKCRYHYNIRIIQGHSFITPEKVQTYNLLDQSDQIVGVLFTSSVLNIHYKGVPLSVINDTKLSIPADYDLIYKTYFLKKSSDLKPKDFLRSAVIQISMGNDVDYDKNSPVKINFITNLLISNTEYDRYKRKVN